MREVLRQVVDLDVLRRDRLDLREGGVDRRGGPVGRRLAGGEPGLGASRLLDGPGVLLQGREPGLVQLLVGILLDRPAPAPLRDEFGELHVVERLERFFRLLVVEHLVDE